LRCGCGFRSALRILGGKLITPVTPLSFGQIHFSGLDLGDARVNRRIIDLADILVANESESWPDKFACPADYRAFQSIVNRPEATHHSVRATHTRLTLERMSRTEDVVLVLHDTTELDYSGRSISGLGPIGNGGGRGWECHNSLAVEARTGGVLGLANQILHRRAETVVTATEGVAGKRDRADRESRLWWLGVEAVGDTPAGRTWIHVCDRGADTFEFLQQMTGGGRSFVIRSKSNRLLARKDGTSVKLHDHMRGLAATAGWRGEAREGSGRSRPVKLQGCWATVTLPSPHVRRGNHDRQEVRVQAIRVWEVDVPAGEKAVEWILLTDRVVTDILGMREVVGYYQRRPIIEEYHKAFKSGCGVEKLQQRSRAALEAAVGITAVLAVGLLELRDLSRDPSRQDEPAVSVVGERAVRVLSVWRLGVAKPWWSVKEFVWALGRLGGHMNRPSDGVPGWQTLWRGLRKLRHMVDYDIKATPTCGTS
jgi:Transposase DDE domain